MPVATEVFESSLVEMLLYGQQTDGRHTQRFQMVDGLRMCKPAIAAAD